MRLSARGWGLQKNTMHIHQTNFSDERDRSYTENVCRRLFLSEVRVDARSLISSSLQRVLHWMSTCSLWFEDDCRGGQNKTKENVDPHWSRSMINRRISSLDSGLSSLFKISPLSSFFCTFRPLLLLTKRHTKATFLGLSSTKKMRVFT